MDVRGQEVGEIPNNYPSSAVDKGGWYIHKTDLRVWKGFACNFSSIELFSVEADIYCAIFVNMHALTERARGGSSRTWIDKRVCNHLHDAFKPFEFYIHARSMSCAFLIRRWPRLQGHRCTELTVRKVGKMLEIILTASCECWINTRVSCLVA